jgi:hypothetical protein
MSQPSPTATVSPDEAARGSLVRTARLAGVFYLGLAVTAALGFLLIRSQIYMPDDPRETLALLTDKVSLARVGIALELGVVLTQALAAVWFFRLFRSVDAFAAGALAAFGLVNAVAVLVSAALVGGALEVALDPALAVSGDPAGTVQVLYLASSHLWTAGGLFFGLWLIPMGTLVLGSGWMPRVLGWVLIVGGVGYVLSTFLAYFGPGASVVADVLVVPASVGEFWMVGYLLVFGVRRSNVG